MGFIRVKHRFLFLSPVICLSICLFTYFFICLIEYLFICLIKYLFICFIKYLFVFIYLYIHSCLFIFIITYLYFFYLSCISVDCFYQWLNYFIFYFLGWILATKEGHASHQGFSNNVLKKNVEGAYFKTHLHIKKENF